VTAPSTTRSVSESAHSTLRAVAKVSLFPFIFVMYSYTTAGPFGLEEQVSTSGPGMSLLYQFFVPFFWCIPISLVAAELTTALPVEGGFYRWTRAAFGDFWGFLAGWWNWSASFLLGAAYAVLFTNYVAPCLPHLTEWERYLLGLVAIVLIAYVNVRGIKLVGTVATVLELSVMGSILIMCLMSVRKWHLNPFVPFVPPHKPVYQVFGVGFALALWLYAGYEQLSSVAQEVDNPQRNYPRALAWVVPLSMLTYLLPTLCSLAAVGDWQNWHDGYFAQAARAIGGEWLWLVITISAAVMALSILNAMVLSTTRMPFAMAEDGYLSPFFARLHPRFGTPWIAILLSSVIYALLAWHSLSRLIGVYIWLRIATSILTVLSAWQLRRKRPDLARAFVIPWGRAGLAYAVIAPLVVSAMAIVIPFFSTAPDDRFAARWGPVALLIGPVAYLLLRWMRTSPISTDLSRNQA
jgi:amino acid transporter